MAVPKTSLSAGETIHSLLMENPEVASRVNKIFPVAADSAELPYIVYRRASMDGTPQKSGQPCADTVQVEVLCYAGRYAEGIELAEAVRATLDHTRDAGIRSCVLSDSEEAYENDAFVQQLVFDVRM